MTTTIRDITLRDDYFLIVGEDFNCGGATQYVRVRPGFMRPRHGVMFSGYGGHDFEIVQAGYEPELDGVDMSEEDEDE